MVEEVEEKGIEKRGDKPDTADRSTKFVDVKHSYMICTERKRHLPMGRSDNHHHHTNTHTYSTARTPARNKALACRPKAEAR